jgi:GTPase involved in cell partitioning and DNA repair
MLGQAREKFAQIAGPQGGTSLNGGTLKSEGVAEIERLETELATQVAGGRGYTFIIG